MNIRRQALQKQNKKTSLTKAQFGIGDDPMRTADAVKSTIQRMRDNPASLANPWVQENPLNRPLSNNLSNVSNINPAVLAGRPQVSPLVKPNKKPTKNPTIGVNLNNNPNSGMNLGLGFNSNKGGRGFGVSTNTSLNGPNNNLLKDSSVTVSGNRIPIEATLSGDGGFNIGLNGSLNDIFNGPGAQARKAKRDISKKNRKKN
tara:strand:- start:307 stop:912 length:606 start_codon:yes stop_codon:yes gene_type:complete